MLKKIKNSINTGNFFEKLFCLLLIKLGFSNMNIQNLEVRNKKYHYIKRKYKKHINNLNYQYVDKIEKNNNVWVCWLQGYDLMPDIVKKCVESIYRICDGKNIHFIDSKNYCEYIKLPEYIIRKWKNGIISNTHFSDIIRTELLVQYGGIWMDATTLLLDKLPEYIYNSNIFMFNMKGNNDIITYNNWFIYAEKDNRILKSVRDLLYAFWKEENKVQDYFIWQIFMKIVSDKYPDDLKNMMYFPHSATHMLYNKILEKYDEDYIENVRKICPIQKLTYKLENKNDNSLYNYIVSDK